MFRIKDLVGKTPLIELTQLHTPGDVRIFAKMEGHNPGGSVKDRAALHMIESALQRGFIPDGTTLVEATSGNTGIALAMMAGQLGIPIQLVMPVNSTTERVLTMKAFGAEVILLEDIETCRDFAEEQSKKEGFYMLDQFSNKDNYLAHYKSTGPEIWQASEGLVTHFVSSMGTTGTIMGTSMYLKEKNPQVTIVGCQPTEGSSIPGIRRWSKEYMPRIFDPKRVDLIMDVSEEEAIATARELAKYEGIFGGMSSGGAAACALRLAKTISQGYIIFICCDRGDRYLSSGLYQLD